MTYLLLQTFLLLLSSYFLGAFVACLIKRSMYAEPEPVAVPASASPVRETVRAPLQAEPAVPRSIDPVQPKIDILPRPEPRPAPAAPDTSRFDRALVGNEPPAPVQVKPAFASASSTSVPSVDSTDFLARILTANSKLPRRSIVEIRPAILKPVTAAAVKPAPQPVAQAPKPAATVVQPAPVAAPAAAPVQAAAPVPLQPKAPGPSEATTAAAAAAVAAAKAAAAASVGRPVVSQPAAAQRPATPEVLTPVQPAAAPAASVVQAGDDDFQRIRAIDEDIDRRLKAIGVRRFDQMARWTAADINRVNQALGLTDRIDREQWIEQAQILAKGGETYYSRNRSAATKALARPAAPSVQPTAPSQPASATAPAPVPAADPPRPMTPSQTATAAAAAVAASSVPRVVPAPPAAAAQPAAAPAVVSAVPAVPASAPAAAPASPAKPERSVAELAAAAAAAIAAASASVTRGHRPIEPISPLSKVDPNIVIPARLSDALKEKEAKGSKASLPRSEPARTGVTSDDDGDDLKRIRGIGVLIEKRLNALGITSYREIANWTSADIDRISQQLDFKGRIERENWVEQARILSAGGHTEFSRRVDRGDVESSRDPDET